MIDVKQNPLKYVSPFVSAADVSANATHCREMDQNEMRWKQFSARLDTLEDDVKVRRSRMYRTQAYLERRSSDA